MNKQEAIEKIESNSLNIGNNDLVVGYLLAKHSEIKNRKEVP